MKITWNKSAPPLGGILFAEYIKSSNSSINWEVQWGNENIIHIGNNICTNSSNEICRVLAKIADDKTYYGQSALEKSQVDSWLTYSLGPLSTRNDFTESIQYLNKVLTSVTYLAGKRLTIADFVIFATLYVNKHWKGVTSKKEAPVHVLRWYNYMKSISSVNSVINGLSDDVKSLLTPVSRLSRTSLDRSSRSADKTVSSQKNKAQEGKYVDLPGAEKGKVVVRFPPEASGYLHIGHAKAALLNQYYQQAFEGKLIMRFDDTNPAKENVHFEKVILEDVELLEIKPDMFTHTSQYFDLMLEYCEKMLKDGKAYVDDTSPELMKEERDQRIENSNRSNSYEKNYQMWQEMVKGTKTGQQCCVRAKIDMQSLNGCMRDPTIYRCKNEIHPRTGDKYKVYPTYDFACPIVDAIEGVTHTLRTMEYHDRDPQFYWFIDALNLRKPHIWEYSRLSMTNTVLSKRKLTWFVEEGLVDGWDDPRMPTVRGVLRRGMTVEGLRQFIIAQGSSRSVVFMEWDKIWAFNKRVIDPVAPRYTVVEHESHVPVFVKGIKEEKLSVPKHPKNSDIGMKDVWTAPKILIDACDAEQLKEGENATFINWGNLLIKKLNREGGKIVSVEAEPNLENKDYKKTLKLTWLAETQKAKFTPTWCVYFDHIISKSLLGKDEDFKKFVGHETKREVEVIGDPELRNLKGGDIIQIQRKGFFRVDVPYRPTSEFTSVEQPAILFYIPDGSTKETPTSNLTASKVQTTTKKQFDTKNKMNNASDINEEIVKQGDLVRTLKSQKASKAEIDSTVQVLLKLKAEYKAVTNTDWKPGCIPPQLPPEITVNKTRSATKINEEIVKQGDLVRNLKMQKAAKGEVEHAVKALLELKNEYKSVTNSEWKPGCVPPSDNTSNKNVIDNLNENICAQGDKVRKLKSNKSDKAMIDVAVKDLLELKMEYKQIAGKDWSPSATPKTDTETKTSPMEESVILEKIASQGSKIRDLKAQKVDKVAIGAEVNVLLQLKLDYKNLMGKEWTPGMVPATAGEVPKTTMDEDKLLNEIALQGDNVRKLKADKAEKSILDVEVKKLLSLKADFKKATGKDWKPGMQPSTGIANISMSNINQPNVIETNDGNNVQKDALITKIKAQGDSVRDLKLAKAPKEEIDKAVKTLLDLKTDYKTLTGTDFPVAGRTPNKTKENKPKEIKEKLKQKPLPKEKKPVDIEESSVKKQTRLGLEVKKEENFSDWYSQVITKSEMIEYYDVSGCYIFRPWSYAIWEAIKDWFDCEIKKLGVQNCYFPIFVSKSVLEKEKTHIADFAPEVAWVTKSGESDMAEPIAVRPTSETVMYPAYAKWIQSYRDLPIKLNQWNNVVRWEFKHPQPFLRTREFLWQEGHTAYANEDDAKAEVKTILDLYARIYTDLLAIPVIKGRKTEKEKFAGGDYTYTVEALISTSGRAIQGATSHHLGQNFSKMFDIIYEDPETQEKKYIYQNSWGVTTRTIGVMIMIHGDNQGLVLPPRVASVQIVIVPCGITANSTDNDRKELQDACDTLEKELQEVGIKVKGDYRNNYSPGWKYNYWELKGVPIRVELGPKDIKNKKLVAVRRDNGDKININRATASKDLLDLLNGIQQSLYDRAYKELNEHIVTLKDWEQFTSNLDKRNIIMAPFCGETSCEDQIKADSTRNEVEAEPGAPSMGAKSLCIPLEQPAKISSTDKCIHPKCTNKPKFYTLFGRSY